MNDSAKEALKQRFIVWVDYGPEGWQPEGFETQEEAIDYMTGDTYGRTVLTLRLTLAAVEVKP